MFSELELIGRNRLLFERDIANFEELIAKIVSKSRFLVLGGAGTIGQAVVKEIFKRNPKLLHVVDISENNLVELVRDLRSSIGYIDGEFSTYALDIGSIEFDALMSSSRSYDYVLNLSALKHVRSEKDPYTLMRMINVNIFNTIKTLNQAVDLGAKKYFCVSTDKAANPANLMGASKRIMEIFLASHNSAIDISTARFANVAFSDGSLLQGFENRLIKKQPIVAPNDVRRYFVTKQESGELCLLSCLLGENGDIFFPKLNENLNLIYFSDIASNYLKMKGLQPIVCKNEEEARETVETLLVNKQWPCYFSKSNTTGEKEFEEFFTHNEKPNFVRFSDIGIVKNNTSVDKNRLMRFEETINNMKSTGVWSKEEIVLAFREILPDLQHNELNLYLDSKM